MRDLVFKNLVSDVKKRRIISASEVVEEKGVRSITRRHFVYIVKELNDEQVKKPLPYLYVLKECNHKEQREKFFCRIKGSLFAIRDNKLYLIFFMHSLKITFTSTTHNNLIKYS